MIENDITLQVRATKGLGSLDEQSKKFQLSGTSHNGNLFLILVSGRIKLAFYGQFVLTLEARIPWWDSPYRTACGELLPLPSYRESNRTLPTLPAAVWWRPFSWLLSKLSFRWLCKSIYLERRSPSLMPTSSFLEAHYFGIFLSYVMLEERREWSMKDILLAVLRGT